MSDIQGFAHMVFFTLKHDTPENREKLIAGCEKYLTDHHGTVHFSVGTMAEEMTRDVNDRDFHVGLHVVFRSAADHDVYQVHPRHLEFIEHHKSLWKGVRVFDSHAVFVRP